MLGEAQFKVTQVEHSASGNQEVHAQDAADVEAVVHRADLDLEEVVAVPPDIESVQTAGEDDLMPTHSSQATQLVARFGDDADGLSNVGGDEGARGAGIDKCAFRPS